MVRPGGVVVLVDCPRDFLTLDIQCIGTDRDTGKPTDLLLLVCWAGDHFKAEGSEGVKGKDIFPHQSDINVTIVTHTLQGRNKYEEGKQILLQQ